MFEGGKVAAEKAAWRRRFRAVREETPPAARADASAGIVARLGALDKVEAAGVVHLFWPLPGEVDLRPLARSLVARGVTVVLPAVVGPRRLAHRTLADERALVPGRFGVLEPPTAAPAVAPAAIDVVLVPGLAFGRDGSRLGYGGGFYDAFLRATPALRLGVCPSPCLVGAVPAQPHDEPVDVVVTERGAVRTARRR